MKNWLPPSHHVGGPTPNMSQQWEINPTQQGPISSATVNVYLKPIAKAEAAAEGKMHEATVLAQHVMVANDGYAEAFAKIGEATGAWRNVQRLAGKIAKADDQQSTPELTADMAAAKVAVPGIIDSAQLKLAQLAGLHAALKADQEAGRPDLPPAAQHDPEGTSGLGWGGLAIAGAIVLLVYKVVF